MPVLIDPNLAMALHALDESGPPWVLLRGEDDLARPSGDVDILISREQLPGLDALLAGVGFCRVIAPGHGSHRFYFCFSPSADFWIKLDIVSDISFGPLQQWRTSLASACLDRRIRKGPYWLPAPADKAWLQLLHLMLDKGEIQPKRLETAQRAAAIASAEDVIADFVDQYMGQGMAARLLDLIRSDKSDEIGAMASLMRYRLTRTAPGFPRLLAVTHRTLRLLGARLQGGGPVVGVMAPDGAGKTTLLHGLGATFPIPSRYVYMGMWGAGPWDWWLRKVPGGRLGKKVFRVLRGGLAVRYHRVLGRLVLMDRVAYDALLPGSVDTSIGGKISNAFALRMGPEPDVLLVLDAPGEVMFARKGEHSVEILENWRQAYLQLADRIPAARVLDADQPQDQVQRMATEIVWRYMPFAAANAVDPLVETDPLQADEAGSDALALHLWRLLDWRFLLPEVQPKRVGYGGITGPDMLSALRLLDPDAALLGSDDNGTSDRAGRAFDVILLSAPDLRLFESAAAAVQPGGWVCAQVRRSLLRRSGPRTLAGWKRTFERAGFSDVSVYWHAPTLDRTARIVPVASAMAVRDTLSLKDAIRFRRTKVAIARLALALGLFGTAIPEGTVMGRRPEEGNSVDLH